MDKFLLMFLYFVIICFLLIVISLASPITFFILLGLIAAFKIFDWCEWLADGFFLSNKK